MNTHSGESNPCKSRARVNFAAAITLGLALCVALFVSRPAHAQSWQAMNTPFSSTTSLMLTDGTVICQDTDGSDWWKLTPDMFGSYTNGTWTQIASMPVIGGSPFAPLYYASAVLADGRVVVFGGEYNDGISSYFNGGAIYDPVANVWTAVAGPGWSNIGNASSCVLPNGQFMLADPFGTDVALLDPVSLTWSSPPPPPHGNYGKSDANSSEGWTLLPDGTILTVDTINAGNSEIFDPIYGNWYSAGNTGAILPVPNPGFAPEIGPQVLRPDGTTVAFGGSGFNAVYNWSGSTTQSPAPGTWSRIQSFPFVSGGTGNPPVQLDCTSAPACLLPNGNVLVATSPGLFDSGLAFFEWDGNRLIAEPATINYAAITPSYATVMLMLPSGQVMLSDDENEVEFYSPIGGANPAWAPAITASPATVTLGQTYALFGTQLNGLSQCSVYGNDAQNATNYPLVRVTMQATGHVIYYRTHDHSTMAIATGSTVVSTNFDVPLTAEVGAAQLVVVTNGISSLPVSVTVTSPPVAIAEAVAVAHNAAKSITLVGTDPNNLPLIFQIVTPPINGTLSNLNTSTGAVTYTPNNNFQGADSLTFTVNNGTVTSQPAMVTIAVAAGVPIAFAGSAAIAHNAGTKITLSGVDSNDSPPLPITYAISKQPANGTLSFLNATAGTVTYLPKANFQGKDTFTFTVSNGTVTSTPALVSLTVAAAAPYATAQTVGIALNTAKSITLSGTDPDVPPLPLSYTIFSTPAHGTLSGLNAATGAVTYTPTKSFKGTDSFLFTVSNGITSAPATVTLIVAPATPTANAQGVAVAHNTAKLITLTGSDPDSPPLALTYAIAVHPVHGTLGAVNATTGAVTYTPTANYQGTDSFTFTVNNGINTSLSAKVTLTVAAGTPTAKAQTVIVVHNTSKSITLAGTDPDVPAVALTYTIVASPAHGILIGFNPFSSAVTYAPTTNYHGTDSFTFTVSNGSNTSAPATVTLTVGVGTPTANPQAVSVTVSKAMPIKLSGSDADTPTLTLTYAIATSPTHGTLTGFNAATGAVTYTPDAGFEGTDSFTFTVSNGTNKSTAAKVTLTVSGGSS